MDLIGDLWSNGLLRVAGTPANARTLTCDLTRR